MKFSTSSALIISYLSISNATGNLRGSMTERRSLEDYDGMSTSVMDNSDDGMDNKSTNKAERPIQFFEYLEGGDEIGIQSTTTKYPATNNNDVLLSSYSMETGTAGSPFESLEDCAGKSSTNDACFVDDVIPPDSSRHYDSLIESKSTRDSLLSTITKAEGGSLGIKVSASASYVSEKSDSSQSISFMIGGYRSTKTRRVDAFSKIKLTDAARRSLAADPPRFLENYGNYYVKSVTYGGSFLGSFDLTAGSSADSNDLQVEASVKYSKGLFSAEGSSEFIQRQNSAESNLQRYADYSSKPDIPGRVIEEPYDLTTQYEIWNEEVNDNPAPLYVYIGRWWDSQDVQNVLLDPENDFDQSTINLFTRPIVVDEATTIVATNERVSSTMVMNALDGIKEWPEVKSDSALSAKANDLYREARSYSVAYSEMNDIQLSYLQSEIIRDETDGINSPYGSWLHYEKSLAPRYQEFMDSMPEPPQRQDAKYNIWQIAEPHRHLFSRDDLPLPTSVSNLQYQRAFCTPSVYEEGMKEYFITSRPNPIHFRITSDKEFSLTDTFQERESFWAYETAQPGTTNFNIYSHINRVDRTNPANFDVMYIMPGDGRPYMVYEEQFWARSVSEDGSC
jgi:hypothetical protein